MRATTTLLLLVSIAASQDDLDRSLSALRASGTADREQAIAAVLALEPERTTLIERLKKVRVTQKKPGWHMGEVEASDGVTRPYQLYIPTSLDPTDAVPLLVHMHGGVARADFSRKPEQVGYGGMLWPAAAEEEKFVVVFPEARRDCMWWSDAGVAHVRAVIREAKRFANIDDDAIVGTGFSDGASGCYYLAMAAPDPFAAFLPMNGHPAVATTSGHQLYLHNLAMTPMFIAMTQDDQLYPAHSVLPHLGPVMEMRAKFHLVSYPTGGHQPIYFKEQRASFLRFLSDAARDPAPMDLRWACADPKRGRFRWVEVLEGAAGAAEGEPDAWPDINVMSTAGRVRIGIELDANFSEAVRVARVVDGSVASALGIRAGDFLVKFDDTDTPNGAALRAVLSRKQHGDPLTVVVRRGEERLTLKGEFPPFRSEPYYSRKKPTSQIAINVDQQTIHVACRNVRKFRLHLSPVLFGDGPITVKVNGKDPKSVTTEVVALEEIVRRFAVDADSASVFTRRTVVEVHP